MLNIFSVYTTHPTANQGLFPRLLSYSKLMLDGLKPKRIFGPPPVHLLRRLIFIIKVIVNFPENDF